MFPVLPRRFQGEGRGIPCPFGWDGGSGVGVSLSQKGKAHGGFWSPEMIRIFRFLHNRYLVF